MIFLLRTLLIAVAATLGDFIWFEYGVRHTVLHGIVHGAALLLVVGLVLGQAARRPLQGILGGIAAGVAGALAFYAAASLVGYLGGLIVAWCFLWLALALVMAWLLGHPRDVRAWIPRGLLAAVASGIVFYLVSGIWTDHEASPNYLWHLVAWTLAWLPGIVVLTARRNR